MLEAGWSGMMSLPRVLNLDPDGTLRVQVLPQAEELRRGPIPLKPAATGSVLTIPAATGELLCIGKKDAELELSANAGSTELMRISYSPSQRTFTVDDKKLVLEASDVPTIHAFVDGSVIEVILGERAGYTKRFYYPGPVALDITIRASGAGAYPEWLGGFADLDESAHDDWPASGGILGEYLRQVKLACG